MMTQNLSLALALTFLVAAPAGAAPPSGAGKECFTVAPATGAPSNAADWVQTGNEPGYVIVKEYLATDQWAIEAAPCVTLAVLLSCVAEVTRLGSSDPMRCDPLQAMPNGIVYDAYAVVASSGGAPSNVCTFVTGHLGPGVWSCQSWGERGLPVTVSDPRLPPLPPQE